MSQPPPDPKNDPLQPDEFDRLEEVHQRMKRKQEVWRKLLEQLEALRKKFPEVPGTEEPKP